MPPRLSRLSLCFIMALILPPGFLTRSSKFPINSKTYKLDHIRTLSTLKSRQLLAPLVSGEYPVHCESDKTLILRQWPLLWIPYHQLLTFLP
jgi:hypothetical protein